MNTQTAHAPLTEPVVPDTLKVSAKETLLFAAKGRGVQIYERLPKKNDSKQYEWVHTPEADLFDSQEKKIGCHYGGPTWESNDGSKVVCDLKAHVASKDENAAPWLLLSAKSHEGEGIFSRVTSIQRLETVGGAEPSTGAAQAKAGKKLRVPYTATYYFYVAKP
jgi:hypothetical protein